MKCSSLSAKKSQFVYMDGYCPKLLSVHPQIEIWTQLIKHERGFYVTSAQLKAHIKMVMTSLQPQFLLIVSTPNKALLRPTHPRLPVPLPTSSADPTPLHHGIVPLCVTTAPVPGARPILLEEPPTATDAR